MTSPDLRSLLASARISESLVLLAEGPEGVRNLLARYKRFVGAELHLGKEQSALAQIYGALDTITRMSDEQLEHSLNDLRVKRSVSNYFDLRGPERVAVLKEELEGAKKQIALLEDKLRIANETLARQTAVFANCGSGKRLFCHSPLLMGIGARGKPFVETAVYLVQSGMLLVRFVRKVGQDNTSIQRLREELTPLLQNRRVDPNRPYGYPGSRWQIAGSCGGVIPTPPTLRGQFEHVLPTAKVQLLLTDVRKWEDMSEAAGYSLVILRKNNRKGGLAYLRQNPYIFSHWPISSELFPPVVW